MCGINFGGARFEVTEKGAKSSRIIYLRKGLSAEIGLQELRKEYPRATHTIKPVKSFTPSSGQRPYGGPEARGTELVVGGVYSSSAI